MKNFATASLAFGLLVALVQFHDASANLGNLFDPLNLGNARTESPTASSGVRGFGNSLVGNILSVPKAFFDAVARRIEATNENAASKSESIKSAMSGNAEPDLEKEINDIKIASAKVSETVLEEIASSNKTVDIEPCLKLEQPLEDKPKEILEAYKKCYEPKKEWAAHRFGLIARGLKNNRDKVDAVKARAEECVKKANLFCLEKCKMELVKIGASFNDVTVGVQMKRVESEMNQLRNKQNECPKTAGLEEYKKLSLETAQKVKECLEKL